jgi:hypothetical protein
MKLQAVKIVQTKQIIKQQAVRNMENTLSSQDHRKKKQQAATIVEKNSKQPGSLKKTASSQDR